MKMAVKSMEMTSGHSLKNQTGDPTGEAIGSCFYRSDQWFTGSQSDFYVIN
jgi:hypothetical protein